MAGWTDFFGAGVGASAARAGLAIDTVLIPTAIGGRVLSGEIMR